jgi:IclR family acetate operon transcriptional repressor
MKSKSFRIVESSSAIAPVQAVARAFALLEALASRDEAGLVELARDVSLHPSTTHRLLASLIDCGYASQSPTTGRYRLGRKVLELASGSKARDARLRAITRPHLEAIRATVDETSNLVALDDVYAIYLDQVESRRAVRLFAEPGRRVPAHASGAGKAMLAYQDRSVLNRLCAREPFERLTPRTVTTAADLQAELERVRRRGYALDNEEYEDGVSCIAAPIFDNLGSAGAAISVSAPSVRLRRSGLPELGALLARHAREISRELGYEAPSGGRRTIAAG